MSPAFLTTLQTPSATLQPPSVTVQPLSVAAQPPSAALRPPSATAYSPSATARTSVRSPIFLSPFGLRLGLMGRPGPRRSSMAPLTTLTLGWAPLRCPLAPPECTCQPDSIDPPLPPSWHILCLPAPPPPLATPPVLHAHNNVAYGLTDVFYCRPRAKGMGLPLGNSTPSPPNRGLFPDSSRFVARFSGLHTRNRRRCVCSGGRAAHTRCIAERCCHCKRLLKSVWPSFPHTTEGTNKFGCVLRARTHQEMSATIHWETTARDQIPQSSFISKE